MKHLKELRLFELKLMSQRQQIKENILDKKGKENAFSSCDEKKKIVEKLKIIY